MPDNSAVQEHHTKVNQASQAMTNYSSLGVFLPPWFTWRRRAVASFFSVVQVMRFIVRILLMKVLELQVC